jgi:hypothetical protein
MSETKSVLEELLVAIHSEVANNMLEDLRDPDKRTPQLYGQIIKFLKDNGIDILYCEKGKNKSAFSELISEVKSQMESYQ